MDKSPNTIMALVNPPPAVRDALAGATEACRAWTPTPVPATPPSLETSTAEAGDCHYLMDPTGHDIRLMETTAFFVLILVGICLLMRVHEIPGYLFRLIARGIRRVVSRTQERRRSAT